MSVEGKRIFLRIAACCLLALFAVTPARVMADEMMPPESFDSVPEAEGMLCMDNMETEPYSDELEPTPVAHADGGCSVSELPIST
ncbi:MAG: hypothetical protein RL274_230 [Pseudomonadota bacterium]|jgi:hypothetical protein